MMYVCYISDLHLWCVYRQSTTEIYREAVGTSSANTIGGQKNKITLFHFYFNKNY